MNKILMNKLQQIKPKKRYSYMYMYTSFNSCFVCKFFNLHLVKSMII